MANSYFLSLRKSCLSPVWKNRLQGLLIGLAIATVSVGIILAVFLTSRLSLDGYHNLLFF